MQNPVGAIGQDLDCLRLDPLRVVEMNCPAACVCEIGEYLAVHDGVGMGLVRRAKLNGYVVGKVRRPSSQRDRDGGFGQCGGDVVECGRCRADNRRPHLRYESGHGGGIQASAVIVSWGGGQAGLDEFNPSTINDVVVG